MDVVTQTAQQAFWSIPPLTGESYTELLKRLHETFKPLNYLEIGVSTGATLALAHCDSIGIDPAFAITKLNLNGKPSCQLFQMGSDEFFKSRDPEALLGGRIDMAFLDGMHWYEFLLRDFINTEAHCKPNSIILLHDCLPLDDYVGRRDRGDESLKPCTSRPAWWAGDVWKTAAILHRYRPDLKIAVFDAAPTGLIAITRLNPESRVLRERYTELVDMYQNYTLATHGAEYLASMQILKTQDYATHSALSTLFWL